MSKATVRSEDSLWKKALAYAEAVAADWIMWTLFLLMAEFLLVAFSGRRSPTGLLLTPEEVLDVLHYLPSIAIGLLLGCLWFFVPGLVGTSPGRALVFGVRDDEEGVPWTRTSVAGSLRSCWN